MVREYVVTLRFEYPTWDEENGIPFLVAAKSKAEAIRAARREALRDGHIGGIVGKGRSWFKAVEAETN